MYVIVQGWTIFSHKHYSGYSNVSIARRVEDFVGQGEISFLDKIKSHYSLTDRVAFFKLRVHGTKPNISTLKPATSAKG